MKNQDTKNNNQLISNNQIRITNIRIWIFKFGLYLCLVSWLLVILVSGCARTVTELFTYGDQVMVEATLRGSFDVNANRYFLVLSANSNYRIPLPPPDLIDTMPEFLEPGDNPLIGSPEAYQTNFYATWAGYVILDVSGFALAKGPFSLGQLPTREALANLPDPGSTITFSFRLGRIFDLIPDTVYFDFITVPRAEGDPRIPADHLPTINNYISKIAGSIVVVDDGVDNALDAALDISSCKIEIQ